MRAFALVIRHFVRVVGRPQNLAVREDEEQKRLLVANEQ